MKVVFDGNVFDENVFDEIDHFHPNFDESAPNRAYELHFLKFDGKQRNIEQ